jgi:predicted transcriptional regulator
MVIERLAMTNSNELYTPNMPSKPVQISLDTELLERIDADEETRLHGRSAFMRSAVERYLRARQRAQIDARIRTAYSGAADAMGHEIDYLMDAQAWPED